jgi:transcriptional regulator with XRE-family HTH domain
MSRKKIDISQLDLTKIGGRFAYVRLFYGQDQDVFAKNIGLSISNVSNVENYKYDPSFKPLKKLIEIYKVNPIWLLTGEGEPYKVVVLEDKRLFLKNDGSPVEEYSEDFALQLEVITREEAEKRKNAADSVALNIDQSNPSTTSESSNSPGADPWQDHIIKTRFILESKTGYANSLAANIESFYDAVVTAEKLKNHEQRLERLEKLSTGREKEEISDTAQAVGS